MSYLESPTIVWLNWESVILLVVGIGVVFLVSVRPRTFWPLLILSNILGVGPRVKGYFILDELLTGFVILGALLRITLRGSRPEKVGGFNHRRLIFLIWVFYMIFESFRGTIVNSDWRIIRWVIFYSELGFLSSLLYYHRKEFPFPTFRQTALTALIGTAIYYVAYLTYGIVSEAALGIIGEGRFAAQYLKEGLLWAGSAMAAFPSLIGMPAALFLINDKSVLTRVLVWGSIALMMTGAFYYDSRVTWMVIFGTFFVSFKDLKIRRVAFFTIILAITYLIFIPDPIENLSEFGKVLLESTQVLWSPGESDINRKLQFQAGWMRLLSNPLTFFLGDGIYSHRFTIIPFVDQLYREYLPPMRIVAPGTPDYFKDIGTWVVFRTTAFTALLIDTGLIGMVLYLINFLLSIHKAILQKSRYKLLFLVTVFLALNWLYVSNITDITLLYLWIMPYGLMEQFGSCSPATSKIVKETRAARVLDPGISIS